MRVIFLCGIGDEMSRINVKKVSNVVARPIGLAGIERRIRFDAIRG
jgi:hypothetical protein